MHSRVAEWKGSHFLQKVLSKKVMELTVNSNLCGSENTFHFVADVVS